MSEPSDTPAAPSDPPVDPAPTPPAATEPAAEAVPEAPATEPAPADAAPPAPVVFNMHGNKIKDINLSKILPYNFRSPGFLSASDLRQLSALHERLIHHLAARLSTFFRMECLLKVDDFSCSTFTDFCESLGNPTHLTLFNMEPLRGVGILNLSLPLSLTMADRLLGGKGRIASTERNLTEIEVTLLEDVTKLILAEWANLWSEPDTKFQVQSLGHETTGRFLQTSAPDAVFVIMRVSVQIGDMTELLHLGIPFTMIEEIVKKMHAKRQRSDEAVPKQIQWRAPYAEISVPIVAEWDVREISLREILALAEGDVLELPKEIINQTHLRLSASEEYVGTTGIQNGYIAVEIVKRTHKE